MPELSSPTPETTGSGNAVELTPTATTPVATAAATAPVVDAYADFKDFLPAGTDPKAFIRETLQARHHIDKAGGFNAVIRNEALNIAPGLAEELLRSPEGRAIAEKIVGARSREMSGEEITPEEKRLLDLAERTEKAEARAAKAEELAQGNSVELLQARVARGMEGEFEAAMKEQPEAEDLEPVIRRVIGSEAKANPELIEPGYVKRRTLELIAEMSEPARKYASRTATKGRATGLSGGGTAKQVDPTTLSRDEAKDLMAEIMMNGSN